MCPANSIMAKLALLCSVLLWHGHVSAQAVTLRFAYEVEEVFPYYVGSGMAIPARAGVTPDMINLLPRALPGLRIEQQRMPWKRCLAQLQNGEIDAVVASFKPDRLALGTYPMKNGQPDTALAMDVRLYYLYKPKGSALNWDGDKLSGLNGAIGAPQGYSIVDDLQKKGVTVEQSRSSGTDFQKMQLNRLAGLATLEVVGDYYVRQFPERGIVKVAVPLAKKEYYLLLSHQFFQKHPELSAKIWRALTVIRDQDADAILVKYLE
jgi:polar amino acid transport system substrate-binding protein